MDRLAYRIVKQARGTPAIADDADAAQLWTQAAADAGLPFTPVFLQHEWEQVILGQDLRTEQAYLTCLRTGRGKPLSKAQRSQVWQAAQHVTAELETAAPSRPHPAGQRGHPTCSAQSGRTLVPARHRGRGPGSAPGPVAAAARRRAHRARMTCSSRPTRTSASTTTASRWPASASRCAGAAAG